ncbi:hypothetical protein F5883DRAFT_621478, partial [Diaporthe sp. PMI_573]
MIQKMIQIMPRTTKKTTKSYTPDVRPILQMQQRWTLLDARVERPKKGVPPHERHEDKDKKCTFWDYKSRITCPNIHCILGDSETNGKQEKGKFTKSVVKDHKDLSVIAEEDIEWGLISRRD